MASRRQSMPEPKPSRRRPATTPEGQENQLISMAVDLAQKRLLEGSASAQEIVHFLKLGSSRERLEQERLRRENLLLEAKTEAIAQAGRMEELYNKAIEAMATYRSSAPTVQSEEFDD